ncbi:predicted GPI-anchored protein 58 [Eucalyptus grandis]|uniref:predicted GPI-anchored protein 58 n=1 Tax=Eucalyptus grandis TaxID=71139 RepID=UPI00192EC86C|nr:predicted GPI-anchored protein 58 [Eucalyptus grandis]
MADGSRTQMRVALVSVEREVLDLARATLTRRRGGRPSLVSAATPPPPAIRNAKEPAAGAVAARTNQIRGKRAAARYPTPSEPPPSARHPNKRLAGHHYAVPPPRPDLPATPLPRSTMPKRDPAAPPSSVSVDAAASTLPVRTSSVARAATAPLSSPSHSSAPTMPEIERSSLHH